MNQTKTSKEPTTMADLMAMYSSKPVKSFKLGQRVKGKVISKVGRTLILDIGGKSEGLINEKSLTEAKDLIDSLKVGDEVTATVLIPETREGATLLSLRHAAHDASWEKLEKAMQEGSPVGVMGKGVNSSGVTVEVEGIIGFIPNSQLGREVSEDTEKLVGKGFKAVPIEVNKLNNKVVLSEKEVSEAEEIKKAKEALSKIKEGDIIDGVVTTVTTFGAFVEVAPGVEGLVHVSELSWGRVETPRDAVKEGNKIKVKVITSREGKLSLSVKQALADPWDGIEKRIKVEDKVKGKVVRVSDFGVFVEVEPGVEGLIHMTNIPPTRKFEHGEEVNCTVQDLDSKAKKMSLGLVLTSIPLGYK